MFQSITFNGTDKKQIGAPIIRRTNEMIYEFNLQYERNYKIVKAVSKRELEFQEFLRQQDANQLRLENLIKILRGYFKENNYNQNTYYKLYKNINIPVHKTGKKHRKKIRPKTVNIRRNKFLFYKITEKNFYFNRFKPYLYPLTNKDKKEFERKIYTDAELKEKEKAKLYNMTPEQLKKFVDVFGFMPSILKKNDDDDDGDNERYNKKKKNKRNSSSFNILYSKKRKNLTNESQINLRKEMSNRLTGKGGNINNSNSLNNIIQNYINNSNLKLNHSMKNIKNNLILNYSKFGKLNYIQNNNIKKSFLRNNKINNYLNIYPQVNKSFNKIKISNRFFNLNNSKYNNKNLNSSKNINNFSSISNFNIQNHSLFNFKNNINNNSNSNIFSGNNTNKIAIKKNINIENIKRNTFTNKCIKTIQKSELLNKDIKYLNKLYDISQDNFNNKKNQIEKKIFKKINFISFMHIYEKDFRPDIKKQSERKKKYEHIKEDMNGNIQVNKIEFIRRPKSVLNFVKVYNKRRDQKRLNKEDFVCNNNDEEKSDLTSYKNKKNVSSIRISRNKINKFKRIYSSSYAK